MILLYRDIISWIKWPDDKPLNVSFIDKLKVLFHVLWIDIIIGTVFLGLVFLIDIHVVRLKDVLVDWDATLLFMLAVIIMPVIEEIMFRFPLKYQRNYLARGLDIVIGGKLELALSKYFKFFIYFMAISFGLIHLSNFDNNEMIFYCLGPIIVGSQLLGGLLLSYTRIKLGFVWAIIQHGLFNLFGIVIGLLFYHNADIINVTNDDFSLRVTELMYVNTDDLSFAFDIRDGVTYKIEAEDINLQRIVNSLKIESENLYHDTWVDVYFKSEKGIRNNEVLELLKDNIRFVE